MKSFLDFKQAARERESSDDYSCVNRYGYLGAYQFGMARLCDLGLTRRKDSKSKSLTNDSFTFQAISRDEFLESKAIQDTCFDMHVHRLKSVCLKKYPTLLKDEMLLADGSLLDLSGAIMVCHLLGPGSLNNLVEGEDLKDALGTKASDYAKLFHGYEIPD